MPRSPYKPERDLSSATLVHEALAAAGGSAPASVARVKPLVDARRGFARARDALAACLRAESASDFAARGVGVYGGARDGADGDAPASLRRAFGELDDAAARLARRNELLGGFSAKDARARPWRARRRSSPRW